MQQGLVGALFYYWRRELKKRNQAEDDHGATGGMQQLVAVSVVDSHEVTRKVNSVPVEIVSPSGFLLKVTDQVDVDRVGRIAAAIEGACRSKSVR